MRERDFKLTLENEKQRLEETQTLRAGCSKAEPKISPAADLGLSVLDFGPMYAADRRQTKSALNALAY